MDITKINDAVKNLSDVDERFDDFFELLGILIDDFADLYKAKDSKQFNKQKRDARITLKTVRRKFENMTFKNLKMDSKKEITKDAK